MDNIEHLLFTRSPIETYNNLILQQHTMTEINNSIGYDSYEMVVNSWTRETYDFEYELEDVGIDYKDISYFSLFQMLCMNNEENTNLTIKTLNFMFNSDFEIYSDTTIEKENKSDKLVLLDKSNEARIDISNFHKIRQVLLVMFFISKSKRRIAGTEKAKEMIRRDKKLKAKESVKINIYSIMSSLVWSPNSTETYSSIVNLSPHQIYDGYLTVEKIKNYDNMMNAYFNGLIDNKKLNMQNIYWSKKIINEIK